jgi:hypothetical protein
VFFDPSLSCGFPFEQQLFILKRMIRSQSADNNVFDLGLMVRAELQGRQD